MRVPTELRSLYGKQDIIRKSLGTSDRHEAISRVRYETFRLEAEFNAKRRELRAQKQAEMSAPVMREIGEQEAHEIIFRWFIALEKRSVEWWENEGIKRTAGELAETLDDLKVDETVFNGGGPRHLPADGSFDLNSFLKSEGIDCPKDSPAYRTLRPLFRLARLENVRRDIDRVTHNTIRPREPLFRDIFAHSQPEPKSRSINLGELLQRFDKALSDANRADVTRRTYKIPSRVLIEVLGAKTPLDSITKESIERLFDLLCRAPANVTKRYPGLTLEAAISEADKRSDPHRLGRKTLENYYVNISAIFNFAVQKRLLADNPAKDRWTRARFENATEPSEKALFRIEELNRLFRAPLYTGCKNDLSGFAKPGPSKPRRGRFWAPLLSLFHGLRCNEAAQLYTEDVKIEDGIPFFEIRKEREDGSKCEKRLKTAQSKRRVPIHPEILKLGFLAFVEERKGDSHPRLFPDLPCGKTGYFSDPFSKWFAGFVTSAVGKDCKGTFHSFRHQFRDALTEAGVPIPDAERIGGWELMDRSAERNYGKGPSLRRLREQIVKVQYPGLDLQHLQIR